MRKVSQIMAALAGRCPWGVLLASVLLAAASGYYASHRLRFTSDRDLVEHSSAFQAKKLEYDRQFDSPSYSLIAFAPADIDRPVAPLTRRHMKAATREFAEWGRTRPKEYDALIERMDPSEFGDLGLLYMDLEDLLALEKRLSAARPILSRVAKDPSLAGLFRSVNDGWDELTRVSSVRDGGPESPDPPAAPPLAELSSVVEACEAAAKGTSSDAPPLSTLLLGGEGEGDIDPEGYFFRDKGRYIVVLVDMNSDKTQLNRIEQPMRLAHEEIARIVAKYPDLRGGVTGEPAMEAEEMDVSVSDFGKSTLGTFLGIVFLLTLSFRRMVRPLLTVVPLLLAIVWTLGATTLVVGQMNLLAMVFAIILIAMGVDYGIVVVAHYERGLAAGLTSVPALAGSFRCAGLGLLTSCLASCMVFLSAAFTKYRGFAELGIIASMGLFLCLLAMTTTLPAILVLVDRRRLPRAEVEPPDPPAPPKAPGLQAFVAIAVVVCAAVGCGVGTRLGWNFDLLALQPKDVESIKWIEPLIKGDRHPIDAISLAADKQALDRLAARYRALPQVSDVQTIFPDHEEEKREVLVRMRGWLGAVRLEVPAPFDLKKLRRQVSRFRLNLMDICERSKEAQDSLGGLVASLGGLEAALSSVDPAAVRRLSLLDEEAARSLSKAIELLKKMSDPGPVDPDRLPALLRQDFVGKDNLLAIKVHPNGDGWRDDTQRDFVKAVRSVDPDALGSAVELWDGSQAIQQSFRVSAAIALGAVLLLLVATFRKPLPVLVAFFPMLVALALLAAGMVLAKMSLNFANYFAVPILLGSGIEYDIHLVQSFRMGAGKRLLTSTRWAVLLCALSTLLGFASLVPARHRGVASLGWVLTIGTVLAYGCAMILVPVIMRMVGRREGGALR